MMRPSRGFLTGVVACLTILFIVLSSKSAVEFADSSGADAGEESYVGELEINNDQTYHRHVTQSLAELGARGNLPKTNKHILMLTRIPDAGAESLVLILQRLQGYNAFKHIRLPPGDSGLLSTLQEELVVEEVTSIIRQEAIPLSFDGDVRFLNFSKFGRQAPTFISLVRNPINFRNVQRVFKSFTNKDPIIFCSRGIAKRETQEWTVQRYHDFADKILVVQRNSEWALQRAKVNIIEWYSVVGVLDCMELSLKVLENKFPYFFMGAIRIYKKIRPKEKYMSDTLIKIKPGEKEVLSKLLAHEIEFYQWLKYRLLNETSDNG